MITIVKPDEAVDNPGSSSLLLPYTPGPGARTAEVNFFGSAFPLTFSLIAETNAPTAADDYWAMPTRGRNMHAIQVSGNGAAFTGSVLVEGSLDGKLWTEITSITTDTIYQFSGLYFQVRVSIPSLTAGNVTVNGITMRG